MSRPQPVIPAPNPIPFLNPPSSCPPQSRPPPFFNSSKLPKPVPHQSSKNFPAQIQTPIRIDKRFPYKTYKSQMHMPNYKHTIYHNFTTSKWLNINIIALWEYESWRDFESDDKCKSYGLNIARPILGCYQRIFNTLPYELTDFRRAIFKIKKKTHTL